MSDSHVLKIDQSSLARSFGMDGLREFHQELRWGNHVEHVLSHKRQEEGARDLHGSAGGTVRRLKGIGEAKLNVDAQVYHYWGQRLGYECWGDEQFLREFRRDNPACRVNTRADKVTIAPGRKLKAEVLSA